MAEQEKFNLLKFLSSFTQWLPWVKTLRYVIGAVAILALVFTIYKAFFTKTQEQHNQVVNKPGGVVNINQTQVNKKWLIWFVEPWVGTSTQNKWDAGIRTGIRLEFS